MTLQNTWGADASIPRQTRTWRIPTTPDRSPLATKTAPLPCIDVARPRLQLAGAAPKRCAAKGNATCTSEALILQRVTFLFFVAPDEEYVNFRVLLGQREVDVGERLHNFLLLTLARERRADTNRSLPDASCGWMYRRSSYRTMNRW